MKRFVVLAALLAGLVQLGPPMAAAQACSVSISPGSASAGARITVSGDGWAADDTVNVNIGGVQVLTTTANGSGAFSAGATVPDLTTGDHNVFAFNDTADCETNGSFTVVDPPPPTTVPSDCSISGSPSPIASLGWAVDGRTRSSAASKAG